MDPFFIPESVDETYVNEVVDLIYSMDGPESNNMKESIRKAITQTKKGYIFLKFTHDNGNPVNKKWEAVLFDTEIPKLDTTNTSGWFFYVLGRERNTPPHSEIAQAFLSGAFRVTYLGMRVFRCFGNLVGNELSDKNLDYFIYELSFEERSKKFSEEFIETHRSFIENNLRNNFKENRQENINERFFAKETLNAILKQMFPHLTEEQLELRAPLPKELWKEAIMPNLSLNNAWSWTKGPRLFNAITSFVCNSEKEKYYDYSDMNEIDRKINNIEEKHEKPGPHDDIVLLLMVKHRFLDYDQFLQKVVGPSQIPYTVHQLEDFYFEPEQSEIEVSTIEKDIENHPYGKKIKHIKYIDTLTPYSTKEEDAYIQFLSRLHKIIGGMPEHMDFTNVGGSPNRARYGKDIVFGLFFLFCSSFLPR